MKIERIGLSGKFLIFVLVLVASILPFAIGVAVGVGAGKDSIKDIWFPLLSTMAGWMSGVGAFFAAFIALKLADRARNEDAEQIYANVQELDMDDNEGNVFSLDIASGGRRPITIKQVDIFINDKPIQLGRTWYSFGPSLPRTLDCGSYMSVMFDEHLASILGDTISQHDNYKSRLGISVLTTTQKHVVEFSKADASLIRSIASSQFEKVNRRRDANGHYR